MIDSVFRISKIYDSQIFLKQCKNVVKGKKMPGYITDDIEISTDSDREGSDEEKFLEKNSDEENFDEEN